ncbi:LytTR family transcriptional regulator DNA-binding domain-containing protein [Ningiella sp. W23]|uniref:LytTR family transcriptional regulator DNA-binding domain-containing protein n=1 Tax=Ningiella sp. W23 TaxID=3023715 RepID=UPI0037575002
MSGRLEVVARIIVFFGFAGCAFAPSAFANDIVECPATETKLSLVEFDAPQCKHFSMHGYYMSQGAVWVEFTLEIPQRVLDSNLPLGFFLSGRNSARVFVNSIEIGTKGLPGLDAQSEVTGPYDWVAYLPRELVSSNTLLVQIQLSAFRNLRPSFSPFNTLKVDEYDSPTRVYYYHYSPILVPLGIILVAIVYLITTLFLKGRENAASDRSSLYFLLFMTVVGLLQLVTEMYRGLVVYDYYVHDIRLAIITFFAVLFGQALLIQSIRRLEHVKLLVIVPIAFALVLASQFSYLDPDLDAAASIKIPAVLAGCILAYSAIKHRLKTLVPAFTLIAFAAIIEIFPEDFLDIYLYYCIAGLLLLMLMFEAYKHNRQLLIVAQERERADKLQLALDLQATDAVTQTLAIKQAGEVLKCPVEDILYCKGAGDYAEIRVNEKTILYSGSLKNLIAKLPSSFIKVHRSYLVNARHIRSLKRLNTGTGEIKLSNNENIPVSRRVLPKLKSSFQEIDGVSK